ncbi:hypothetical protein KFE98_10350 [bacterium SCSIO 12741]|nr:hypothetical protein KFE98_10350 [bacterium SCSIO 12741]
MVKRVFRFIGKSILALLVLALLSYAIFHLSEYLSGGTYVEYLEKNSETVDLDTPFSFSMADEDFASNDLILVGEIHGFDQPTHFDVNLFKHLHGQHGVRTYLAELDYVQGILLNQFLENGDTALLRSILKKWVVVQGRNNLDYENKYGKLHTLYSNLPEDQKFRFLGIDKMQDATLWTTYLNQFIEQNDTAFANPIRDGSAEEILQQLQKDPRFDSLPNRHHLITNLEYVINKNRREEVLFQNFYDRYQTENLRGQKLYGYFGLYHVFQYRINGKHPMASQIRSSDLGLEEKILSMNFMMNESYMVMKSKMLPEFMRDPSTYTKMPISADNLLFMYVYGVKDFKRVTPENSKSLYKMNGKNSPYSQSSRLSTTFQILPFAQTFEMTDEGKPYIQYTIFVRGSDWAEPLPEAN